MVARLTGISHNYPKSSEQENYIYFVVGIFILIFWTAQPYIEKIFFFFTKHPYVIHKYHLSSFRINIENAASRYTEIFIFMQFALVFLAPLTPPYSQ